MAVRQSERRLQEFADGIQLNSAGGLLGQLPACSTAGLAKCSEKKIPAATEMGRVVFAAGKGGLQGLKGRMSSLQSSERL